jgi:alkylated DNA repair dioxygenase AlkB
MQGDLFGTPPPEPGEIVKLTDGEYRYFPTFFNRAEADSLLKAFMDKIDWQQEEMNMYGKVIKFPRLTAWYGDDDKPYSFSGITLKPKPWNEELLKIKSLIEPLSKTVFNSVLLNLYRDGNDSISWHTDAEKELGKNPIIASVNFGQEREFQLRHRTTGEKLSITLQHGSLLIMQGELQHHWQHQVPKRKNIDKARVNLTFRKII